MQSFPLWACEVPTPSIIYHLDRFQKALQLFSALCDHRQIGCCFAVKANRHPDLLTAAAEVGFGFDIASAQELNLVSSLKGGSIVASSPGLSVATMKAVDVLSGTIFFDNAEQLARAEEAGIDVAHHGLRLAMPGDYSAFGFSLDELATLRGTGLTMSKVHVHAGEYFDAQLTGQRLEFLRRILAEQPLDLIDFGGGFGVLSNDHKQLEAALVAMRDLSCELKAEMIIEPGKAIAARCGYLVASVLATKERVGRQIVVIDSSSFNLGQMERRQLAMSSKKGETREPSLVIGPTCFEGDIWGEFVLPRLAPGDRLMFSNMGAYTTSIAASLHGLPEPQQIVLKHDALVESRI